MSRKNAAILLALVMTVQSAAGAAAGEVPEGILQETEAFAELEASVYSDEESLLPADESAEEVEIVQEEDYSDEILSGEDMIIEADSAEEDILDVQGFPTEDESALELFEEDDSFLIAASDDGESDEDFFELNGDYSYNVDPGVSLTLELPAGQAAGGTDFSWTKRVTEPFVDEYGSLFECTTVTLEGETSPQLQLDHIQETALYTLSWVTSDNSYVSKTFTVTVKNGFRTYSAQESGSFELEENEQITLSIDARANDTEGMRYLWFSGQNDSSYQKLDALGSSYTVTAPRNATQYVCYVIDKYHNAAQYYFYAAIKNLVYDGPQNIYVAVNKGQQYTMTSPITTVDGTDDQLQYEWIDKEHKILQVFTSSYTPSKIEDGDVYKCKVTDHLGNFYDLYWHFTVPEEGTGLVLECGIVVPMTGIQTRRN